MATRNNSIVPVEVDKMLSTANKDQLARVTSEMLKMAKFDIKTLRNAYEFKSHLYEYQFK